MNITDFLIEYKIPFASSGTKHNRAGWIQFHCPYCDSLGNKWHLGFNLSSNYFHCWKCGGKQLNDTLQKLSNLDFRKLKEILKEVNLKTYDFTDKKLVSGKLKLPTGLKSLSKYHIKYLENRNFNPEEIVNLYNVKAIENHNRLSWRLFIPIYHNKEIVSWTTRTIKKSDKIRYISAKHEEEKIHHKHILYASDLAGDTIIVNEGPIDSWAIGPGAVCTFGTSYKKQQIEQMIKYPIRVVCFDSSKEAQKRAEKLADDLSMFPGETYNIRLTGKDAAETDKKEIQEIKEMFLL